MCCHVVSTGVKGHATLEDVLHVWKLALKNCFVNVEPAFYIHLYLAVQNHQLVVSLVPGREHVNMRLITTVTRVLAHRVLFYARSGAMDITNKDLQYCATKTTSAVGYLAEKTCLVEDTNVSNLVTTDLVLPYATSHVPPREDCVVIFAENLATIHHVQRAVVSKKSQ